MDDVLSTVSVLTKSPANPDVNSFSVSGFWEAYFGVTPKALVSKDLLSFVISYLLGVYLLSIPRVKLPGVKLFNSSSLLEYLRIVVFPTPNLELGSL